MKIIIKEIVKNVMYEESENAFPNECCGFLYGSRKDDIRHFELARPVKNSKQGDQRRRFEISPFDYMKAEQYALLNNIELLGIYHTHPNHPAIPSIHDLKQAMPFFSYFIISVMDGKIAVLRSWRLNEAAAQFDEETILEKK